MDVKELLLYRTQVLSDNSDSDGYISEEGFLEGSLPWLNETKHIDTTDVTNLYDPVEGGTIKANAYTINESGERLQIFVINEESLDVTAGEAQLMISQRQIYDKQFSRAMSFVKKSIKKQMGDLLQDGSPAWVLVHQLGTSEFMDQIDVIEIFLLSATATIEPRGNAPSVKMLEFEDEELPVSFRKGQETQTKNLIVMKRLIDLNFLYNVHIAQGSRYPLVIDFSEAPYNFPIPFLHAASEAAFDSYLCALPASLLAELYKRHSSRLLEKNVRSFLQIKGVNKGMQDTIRKEPEKFIAYNNGLTITATASTLVNIKGIQYVQTLSDFQIVNGGQTTATLYFSKRIGLDISDIRVMAKINVAKNATEEQLDDLISNISTYSNAQSKVSKVDLRARSPQLVKLKSLSESVLTVSGKKWFFERAKGEYATMLRVNAGKKNQLEKIYPKERRFTKEDLAKYYASWGDRPFAVKKGGEKIFRLFLEEITGEGKSKKATGINRFFYEDLIARIILFRSLENIYGAGKNSLGQLRSAVVPYSMSALYAATTGKKKAQAFDLLKIWKTEKLDDDMRDFFRQLMILMNELIKKYSKSDDLGEYSKKEELWEEISASKELEEFMTKKQNQDLIDRYTVSATELKKREKAIAEAEPLSFEPLLETAEIFDRGVKFYKNIRGKLGNRLNVSDGVKLDAVITAIEKNVDLDEAHLKFEKELMRKLTLENSELLEYNNSSELFKGTVNFIIRKFNSAINAEKNIQTAFDVVKEQALKKKAPFYSVYGEIGKRISSGQLPTMLEVLQASHYFKLLNP